MLVLLIVTKHLIPRIPPLVSVFFIALLCGYLIERLQGFIDREKHPVRQIVIDASGMASIDYTAVEKLRPFFEKLISQGIDVAVARAPLPLRELKLASELEDLFPEERTFPKVSDAVAAFKARTGSSSDAE